MKTALGILLALTAFCAPQPGASREASEVELYRLDCGSIEVANLDEFSDTYLYEGQSKTLVVSCYLIRHGSQWLLWDAGLDGSLEGSSKTDGGYTNRLSRRLIPQLAQVGARPADITFLGLSHYHFDHIGQAADFQAATLLVGRRDWDAAKTRSSVQERLKPWMSGTSKMEQVQGDRDVFGDGRVMILSLPGHTEGHQGLLVRLKSGAVLLTGDQYHFAEQVKNRGVPSFNTSRADTLASMERFEQIARRLRAKVIIQHEPSDVAKLPAFPAAAR